MITKAHKHPQGDTPEGVTTAIGKELCTASSADVDHELSSVAQLRMLQFFSPAMPVGAYSYSQGLEWAVNSGWIIDVPSFKAWVDEQIRTTLARQELPLLRRLFSAAKNNDIEAVDQWSQLALAVRDTHEMREEERARAAAYFRVLETICPVDARWQRDYFLRSPLVSMSWFSAKQRIDEAAMVSAFSHNWLENTLITGVKIIPLGQSSAQRLLFDLAGLITQAAQISLQVNDDDIGMSLPAVSMASCGHETQYSRVYRS